MSSTIPPPPPRPVLTARGARIEIDGAVAVPELELTTRGDRVLLVGSTGPLVTALAGTRQRADEPLTTPMTSKITRGDLAVLERSVKSGAHRAVCGIALSDPPLPWRWTVKAYLTWAARLDGATRRQTGILLSAVTNTLSLGALMESRLRRLSMLERRVVVLASAIVSQPAVVVVDDPFGGLDAREAGLMMGALGHAAHGRAAIIAIPRLRLTDPSGELAKSASDIVLVQGGRLVLHDDALELLSHGRLYEVTVLDGAEALRASLAELGIELVGGPHHFSVVLTGDLGPSAVLAAAARARVPVTSCLPLIG